MDPTALALYLSVGAIAGLLAGLLGVGGGLVIVPALTLIFTALHFPEGYILHLALGTSLATIIFTSLSSVRAHHAHHAVNWLVVRTISPGIVVGTLLGTVLASQLSSFFLKIFLICFLFFAGTQMLLNFRPAATRQLPGLGGMFLAGNIIGVVSSFVGIGGGTLSVPFMSWCNVRLHEAIGTSSAIGFPIAISGAVGYAMNGMAVAELPSGSVGFVYVPALIGIAVASMLTAPVGARWAHRLPVQRLKKVFALFLFLVAARMLWSVA